MTGFADLQNRLIELIRAKLRNGEITERGLARRVGVSQPHLHNVLKRVRLLTTALADHLLIEMNLSLTDLLDEQERFPGRRQTGLWATNLQREIPLLSGVVGPGHPWPRHALGGERFLFPTEEFRGLELPVFVSLASDIRMEPLLAGCNLALLDLWNGRERELRNTDYYVVRSGNECLIRRVNRGGRLLYLVAEDDARRPESWETVAVRDGELAGVILARVVWVGQEPSPGMPLGHSGCFLGAITSR